MLEALVVVMVAGTVLAAPLVALFMAAAARRRVGQVEQRMRSLEQELRTLRGEQGGQGRPAEPHAEPGPTHPQPDRPTVKPAEPGPASPAVSRWRPEPDAARRTVAQTPYEERQPGTVPPPAPPAFPWQRSATAAAPPGESSGDDRSEPAEADGGAKTTLEQRLATQVMLWLGAAALALAGVFMVRYFAEHAVLSERMRIVLAGLFGVGLLVAGQFMGRGQAKVAAAMTAAGVAICYAAVWAATNLYELLPPTAGAAGLAVVTALAVGMSLRHGMIVALLGLVGGFLMPALTGTTETSALGFFGYMLLLQTALVVLGRYREWWPLIMLALLGSLGWTAAWVLFLGGPGAIDGLGEAGLFVLISAALFVGMAMEMDRHLPRQRGWAAWLAWGGGLGWLALAGVVLRVSDYGTWQWVQVGLLAAGCVAVGRLRERRLGVVAGVGLLTVTLMVWMWAAALEAEAATRFLWTLLALTLVLGGGTYAALWGSERPQWWATAATAVVSGAAVVAWWYVDPLQPTAWWAISGVAAAVLAVGAWYVGVFMARPVQERGAEAIHPAIGPLATGATGLIALALHQLLTAELTDGTQWVATAWAAQTAAVVGLAGWLTLPMLRTAAALLATAVALRLLLNPGVFQDYVIGDGLIFNWLLYAYGGSAACFALGAWFSRRGWLRELGRWLEGGAALLATAGAMLIVRHAYQWPAFEGAPPTLTELGWYAVVSALLGFALWEGSRRWGRPVSAMAGCALLVLSGLGAVVATTVAFNPLWMVQPEAGEPVDWTALTWALAVPAVLTAVARWRLRPWRRPVQEWITSTRSLLAPAGLWLSFWWITLMVRRAFQDGPLMYEEGATSAEWYAYSAAWIVFAALLLGIGIWRGGHALRWASLVMMCLAVGKVFVLDMAHLEDLWRVASFLGLGLSLLAVAWVYQRFVFGLTPGEQGNHQ